MLATLLAPLLLLGAVSQKGDTLVFTLKRPAQQVFLAGTFNNWNPTANPMEKGEDDTWTLKLVLPPGRYEYKFVADGTWLEDPDNPNKSPDGYGGFNSVVLVAPKGFKNLEVVNDSVVFRFAAPDARQVYLAGTFNNWAPTGIPMKKKDGYWEVKLYLTPGQYQYKFVINGTEWKEDPLNPARVDDGYGGFNSVFVLTEDGKIQMTTPGKGPTGAATPIVDQLEPVGQPLYLAIVWHQHQPRYFKDPETGEYQAPWVRLHGIKDYYDMAAILTRYPRVHFTVNLTPVLLLQLEDLIDRYDRGLSPDVYVRMTLKPAAELTDQDKAFLLENFFSANWDHMIDIWPRYRELRLKRVTRPDGSIDVVASIPRFTEQDWRDLQMWFNLAWFDPDFQESTVVLVTGDTVTVQPWIQQGRNFTEADKKAVIDLQFKILKAIVPLHRRLQEEGRLEVITTPFFHPILPLIYNTDLARQAMPTAPLPRHRFRHPEDARWHVVRAYEYYQEKFGRPPKGLWPGEGAVADSIVDLVKEAGFQWMASDKNVLARSLGGFLDRAHTYQAYRVVGTEDTLYMVFRDTDLSDRIGFRYQKMDPVAAANDFLQALYDIHRQFPTGEPRLVTVILDGENAWEWYPHDAKDFFHAFYDQLNRASWLRCVRVSDFLQEHPPTATIENLWAGSWINADFSTWIGEPEENHAWDFLARVRADLDSWELSPELWDAVFLEMAAAEGSDWFWWFGKDQEMPGGDKPFDRMFRNTLKNVYRLAGKPVPAFLDSAIVGGVYAGGGGVMAQGGGTAVWDTNRGRKELDLKDPVGDEHGPGYYEFPTNPVFEPGLFDLQRMRIYRDGDAVVFVFTFGKVTNPWGAPLGFSHQLLNVFIGTTKAKGGRYDSKSPALPALKFSRPWQVRLKVAGWPDYGLSLFDERGQEHRNAFQAWAQGNDIFVRVAASQLPPGGDRYVYVLVSSQDGYAEDNIRPLETRSGEWVLGGKRHPQDPPVLDLLAPEGAQPDQKTQLQPPYELVPVPWKGAP